jgi:hypothetical protein
MQSKDVRSKKDSNLQIKRKGFALMSEKDYYGPIKKEFERLFKDKVHLEITANKVYSNKLKAAFPAEKEIVFKFLKEAAPDILGFIKPNVLAEFFEASTDFVMIENKDEVLKLDYIYQARKYAELFDAKHAFLVSIEEIPEELKRLSKVVPSLLSLPTSKLVLVQFDAKTNRVADWFKENPFDTDGYL